MSEIDLLNFFIYFDKNNPKHVNGVQELAKTIREKQPEQLQDSANWVRIYRTPVDKPQQNILNIPWFPQTDNFVLPDSTCNSSACAMCLEYFKPSSLPSGSKGDDAYLRKVLAIGKSTDHEAQTKVLLSYGINSVFRYDLSFSDLDHELAFGRPIVLGFLHRGPESAPTGSGHMVVCIGKTENGDYVFRDPYGSIHSNYTGPVSEGRQVVYSKKMLEKRWTIKNPKDGWGRVFLP